MKQSSLSNSGFTAVELILTVVIIGILAAIAVPSWLTFLNKQKLRTAQDQAYSAMRLAQSKAKATNLVWRVSFRTNANSQVQWVVYSGDGVATDELPADLSESAWQNLVSGSDADDIAFDSSLDNTDGARTLGFSRDGRLENGLASQGKIRFFLADADPDAPETQYCVFVSTLIGGMRLDKDADCGT